MSDGPAAVIVDSTGANIASVKPASTAAVATDPALVVAVSPNNTVPVSAASLPLPAGAATAANQTTVGNQTTKLNDGTNTAAVTAANALKVDGSAVTQPVSAASLPLPTGAATEATLAKLPVAQGSTTAGESGPLVQGAVTTAAPAYTTAQTSPLSLTTAGGLRVDGSGVTQPVSAASLPLPAGAATSANQTTLGNQTTKLNDGTNTAAVKAASTAAVATDPALVVAVSPNNTVPVSAASLPLPAGAATAANQTTLGNQTSKINDGTNTAAVKAASTAAVATDPALVVAISPNNVIPTSTTETIADNNPFTDGTSKVLAAGFVLDETAGTALTENDAAAARIDSKRAQVVVFEDATTRGQRMAVTAANAAKVDGSAVTQPISAASLPLPTGAATETTLGTRLADATFTGRINTLGQKTMANSTPVVLSSDQTVIPVGDNAGSLTVDTPQLPAALVGGRLDENVGAWLGSTAPTVGQKLMAASVPVVLASDQSPVAVTFATPSSFTGVSGAIVSLGGSTANTLQVMRATAYTEPASAAQRSMASASANDAAAGTGARTVRLTYFDGTGAGPFTEIVTLNGTTPVNTVATNIRFIESLVVLTVGSGGANAGIITLFGSTAGGGGTVGTIGVGNIVTAIGDLRTLWCHHYSPINTKVEFSTVVASIQSGGSGTNGRFFIRVSLPLTANSADVPVGDVLLLVGFASRSFDFHPNVTGFCRTTGYCVPGVNNATVTLAFDWQEVPV